MTGDVKGSGSITVPATGTTGSMITGLPTGKKNLLLRSLYQESSANTIYYALFLDGILQGYASYRQNNYAADMSTYNLKFDPDAGVVYDGGTTGSFPTNRTFRYLMW